MVKNMVDVIFGGLSYWLFGFGLSFGTDPGSNGFVGVGYFLTDAEHQDMGNLFARFFFQLSFATTATTIVSGMSVRPRWHCFVFFVSIFEDEEQCLLTLLRFQANTPWKWWSVHTLLGKYGTHNAIFRQIFPLKEYHRFQMSLYCERIRNTHRIRKYSYSNSFVFEAYQCERMASTYTFCSVFIQIWSSVDRDLVSNVCNDV